MMDRLVRPEHDVGLSKLCCQIETVGDVERKDVPREEHSAGLLSCLESRSFRLQTDMENVYEAQRSDIMVIDG